MRRKLLIGAVALSGVLAGTGTAVHVANGQVDLPGGAVNSAAGGAAATIQLTSAKKSGIPDIILCRVSAKPPFDIGSGFIRLVVTGSCSKPVAGMKIRVIGSRDQNAAWSSGFETNNNQSFITNGISIPCRPGSTYESVAQLWVWYPPGYKTASGATSVSGTASSVPVRFDTCRD